MKASLFAGGTEAEFWQSTPFVTRLRCEAVAERERNAYRHDLFTAWHAGLFSRVKKLPKLKDVLRPLEQPRQQRQSPAQILRAVEMINAQFGGADKRNKRMDN